MKNIIRFIFGYFPHLLKSLIFCLRTLPFSQAKKIPIVINRNTKIDGVRNGVISLECSVHPGVVFFGFGGVGGVTTPRRSYIRFGEGKGAKIVFKGPAIFAKGASLSVDRGKATFGSHFSANDNFYLSCNDEITFGDNAMIGWEVKFMDSDNHTISTPEGDKSVTKPIFIGNHVWIASYADFLKGASVGDDSIVAYRSCVTKKFEGSNLLIGGYPAKVISENVTWRAEASFTK